MAETNYNVSGRCPVCDSQMYIRRLECGNCHSALEGRFQLGTFQKLNNEQLQFLEIFIRCRGQNKAVQEMLNISYPTVTKKLDELIIALGYDPEPVTAADRKREVLEMLREGKINALQAQEMLTADGSRKES
jgi:hypothetical protein